MYVCGWPRDVEDEANFVPARSGHIHLSFSYFFCQCFFRRPPFFLLCVWSERGVPRGGAGLNRIVITVEREAQYLADSIFRATHSRFPSKKEKFTDVEPSLSFCISWAKNTMWFNNNKQEKMTGGGGESRNAIGLRTHFTRRLLDICIPFRQGLAFSSTKRVGVTPLCVHVSLLGRPIISFHVETQFDT